jgi:hypothetical protein
VERTNSTLGALATSLRRTSTNAPTIRTQVRPPYVGISTWSRPPSMPAARSCQRVQHRVDPAAVCCLMLQDFVACCDNILPFFDHLGPVFHVARNEVCCWLLLGAARGLQLTAGVHGTCTCWVLHHRLKPQVQHATRVLHPHPTTTDTCHARPAAATRAQFQGKLESIKALAEAHPQLRDIVDADRRANTATVRCLAACACAARTPHVASHTCVCHHGLACVSRPLAAFPRPTTGQEQRDAQPAPAGSRHPVCAAAVQAPAAAQTRRRCCGWQRASRSGSSRAAAGHVARGRQQRVRGGARTHPHHDHQGAACWLCRGWCAWLRVAMA